MITQQSIYPMNICYRYYELERFFADCYKEGFKNAELWLCPQHILINADYMECPEKIQDLSRRYQVKIRSVCPEQNNPKPANIAARSEILKEYTKRYFKNVINFAYSIGAEIIVVTSGWSYYDEEIQDALERSACMLQEICDYASSKGLQLAMETVWEGSTRLGCNLKNAQKIYSMVERKNFKLTLDLSAAAFAGETIEQWMHCFGKDIIHCHFVDTTRTGKGHMPWGYGDGNLKKSLDTLNQYDFCGGLVLEYTQAVAYAEPGKYLHETAEAIRKILL